MNSEQPPRALVCWCPDWPVLAAGADPDAPVAILAGEGPRRIVVACSSAARAAGVHLPITAMIASSVHGIHLARRAQLTPTDQPRWARED